MDSSTREYGNEDLKVWRHAGYGSGWDKWVIVKEKLWWYVVLCV